jgi:UDP-N-acetylglucosamine--N-acetylmuramyl-(pentapeptide) pyrophosphoryl-undecaprenol N-acetylglucosamine transferase
VTRSPENIGAVQPCIAFTGGGTGGHVYPGIAVIERLRGKWGGRISWIGSGKEVERQAVVSAGVEFFAIPSGKLRRTFSILNLSDALKVLLGFFAARRILTQISPSVLFSKGGYVSVPPCMAAFSLGIPVITHESDLSPGLATRLNARYADRILVSWEKTLDYLKPRQRSRAQVVGNPVRAAIGHGDAANGRSCLGFDGSLPLVLVLGGSQGALQVNELMQAILPSLEGAVQVAHQSGPGNPPCKKPDKHYNGFEFVGKELPDILAAADIIVGRAGAGTVWEGAVSGVPMVLIPLSGSGSRGDQVENAKLLADSGAAVCLAGAEATPERLLAEILRLAGSTRLREGMARSARNMARPDAAEQIAGIIIELAGKERKA